MEKIIKNQNGVTLIETIAAVAIIAIIMVTILGTLLYGQKMIVFSDTKNSAASIGQDQIDEIMSKVTSGNVPGNSTFMVNGHKVKVAVTEVDKDNDAGHTKEGCDIKVQVYYNGEESFIELTAYALKGGVAI